MRYLLVALLVAALGTPFVAAPEANAQVMAPCAVGQAAVR